MKDFKERWLNLWQRIDVFGKPDVPFSDLISRYKEKSRKYHNLKHILDCLLELEEICNWDHAFYKQFMDVEAVEIGIWYHDAVYNTKAKDNEEKSAELWQLVGEVFGIQDKFITKVSGLILATKHESNLQLNFDAQVLCDIDLSILGKPPNIFNRYEEQIRKEYELVTEEKFVAGRKAILESFLNRSSIYQTEFFKRKYEYQAQENLKRSIKKLSRLHP